MTIEVLLKNGRGVLMMAAVGNFNRKRFLITAGSGFLALLIFSLILADAGFAFPITNIGGGVIYADRIVGDGFLMAFTYSDTSPSLNEVYATGTWPDGMKKADRYPVLLVVLKRATAANLTFVKDIRGLSTIGLPFDNVRLWIRGGDGGTPAVGDYLTLNITGLTAGTIDLKKLVVDENGPAAAAGGLPYPFTDDGGANYLRNPNPVINSVYIGADPDNLYDDELILTAPEINTHMLYAGNISIPNMRFRFIIDPTTSDETAEKTSSESLPGDDVFPIPGVGGFAVASSRVVEVVYFQQYPTSADTEGQNSYNMAGFDFTAPEFSSDLIFTKDVDYGSPLNKIRLWIKSDGATPASSAENLMILASGLRGTTVQGSVYYSDDYATVDPVYLYNSANNFEMTDFRFNAHTVTADTFTLQNVRIRLVINP
ncbi:MAG: hypothetical protein AB1652_06235 [Bacillota bacterium]